MTAFERLWEARLLLDKVVQNVHNVATLAALCSREASIVGNKKYSKEEIMKVVQWRTLLKIRLVRYLRAVMSVTGNPDHTVALSMVLDEAAAQSLDASKAKKDRGRDPSDIIDDPLRVALSIHELVYDHNQYLPENIEGPMELKIHRYLDSATQNYAKVTKFSTTPVPYPICHLLKWLLLLFNFFTPGSIVQSFDEGGVSPIVIGLLTFFVTFGFNALEATTQQLDDPFSGHDPNNLEIYPLLDGATRSF